MRCQLKSRGRFWTNECVAGQVNSRPMSRSSLSFSLLLLCFTLSGTAGLIYQTAWSQQLAHVFGASEMAVATVLAAYMGGLALGAAVAGRVLHRPRRPVLLYGVLELAIAVAALAVPAAIHGAQHLQIRWLSRAEMVDAGSLPQSLFFYLLASVLILLVPTALMGATLPVLARRVVQQDAQIAPRIGALYAANTGGAALGAWLSAYQLLPHLGLDRTVWIAVGLNGAVFLAALWMSRLAPPMDAAVPARPRRATEGWRWHGVLPVMALSGAVSFTYEILWTRLLTHLLGGSIYAFGTMLATFLMGLTLGAALISRWATTRRRARHLFAVVQMAIALTAWGAFLALGHLPAWNQRVASWELLGGPMTATWLAVATLLPGATAIGATFPLAVRMLASSAADSAVASARIFSWNTVGAITGAIGAGFFLLPAVGYAAMVQGCAAVSLLLASWASRGRHGQRWLRRVAKVLVLAVIVAAPTAPESLLRHSVLGGSPLGETRFSATGRSANVLLVDRGDGWRLSTNGLPEALILPPGARLGELPIARWLTHLPFIARPEASSMLVIGLGGGSALEEMPASIERLHVVELEPRVIEANRRVAGQRRVDPLADPRLHLHVDDARSALRLTRQRFEAIVSQPSHPWTAGASHLFTEEFFQQVDQRLTPDGVFVQWIGLAFIDEALLRSLVATLQSVFPYVEVYVPEGQALLFLASREPLDVASGTPHTLAESPTLWSRLGIYRPADLLAHRLLSSDDARQLAVDVPLIRDGANLLQSQSPRLAEGRLQRQTLDALFAESDALDGLDLGAPERLHTAWRLSQQGFVKRATRVLRSLDTPHRLLGEALIAVSTGQASRAPELLRDVSNTSIGQDARPYLAYAHLQTYRDALAAGRSLAQLGDWLEAEESAVMEGWPLAQNRQWLDLSNLDAALAKMPRDHPLFLDATRLRVQWRLANSERLASAEKAEASRVALELLEDVLGTYPQASDLQLRIRAAHQAGRLDAFRATLFELTRGIEQRRYPGPTLTAVLPWVERFETLASPQEEAALRLLQQRLEVLQSR